jgi:hypothetical protein
MYAVEIRELRVAVGKGVEDEDEWDVAVKEGSLKGGYGEGEEDV